MGKYLEAFCLVTIAGEINFADFDPSMFRRYKRPRKYVIGTSFIATFIREHTWRSDLMAKSLSSFDDTNEVLRPGSLTTDTLPANYDPHVTHSQSRPVPEPMINDTTCVLVASCLHESPSCFDNQNHLAQSNPTPPFPSSLAPDMMSADPKGVSPSQLREGLQVFAQCPPDPREGADSDSCADILMSSDNERTPTTHVPSKTPVGTRTTDVPFENLTRTTNVPFTNLTAVPPDTSPVPQVPTMTSSMANTTDDVMDSNGLCHGGHNHDVFYDANSGDDEIYDHLMQSSWATGEANNSFCDAKSDCTRLTEAFYDTNSDRAPMEDSFFTLMEKKGEPALTFPASTQSNVDRKELLSLSCNGDQSHANLGEPESDIGEPESDPGEPKSTLPPTTVVDPTGELNRETPLCSNVGHVWSLLSLDFLKKRQVKYRISLDFLKKRQVKYKMFMHIFASPRPFLSRLLATPSTHPAEVQPKSVSSQEKGEVAKHVPSQETGEWLQDGKLISRLTSLCLSHSQDCGHCDLFVICSA
jgi:hypothetical protein